MRKPWPAGRTKGVRRNRSGAGHVLTSGEEAEFAELVGRQARLAFRVAYAVLVHSADAEDVVQETFLKLFRQGGWQGAASEAAFVARVTWRTAVDLRRAQKAAVRAEQPLDGLLDPASPAPGPDALALLADQEGLVHRLIDGLPDDLRVPLVLSSIQELNSREMAALLGVPEGTVRTRLQRARAMLRQKLESLGNAKEARHA